MFEIFMTPLYMIGGQFGQAWRAYGLMALIFLKVLYTHNPTFLPLLLCAAVLVMGFGEKSWMFKTFGDWGNSFVRLTYASFILFGVALCYAIRGHSFSELFAIYFMILFAYQTDFPSFKIKAFGKEVDFVWDDFARGIAFSIMVALA